MSTLNKGYGLFNGSSGGGGGGDTVTNVIITSADFSGSNYTNALLSGLTPDVDFLWFSDEGSGTLQKVGDAYTFSGTTITSLNGAGNYRLQIITS